ncbi:CRISPR-associated endoribonuclease Cas6 [Thermoplasma sp. Kam2015]|uniref:CRISPR-associated endoribonuclease Cas6 n=1 Tax=Thermoplasma sp. Kam2015 TaxID=2094122 RepID=UPI000D8AF075|nr:CRISPR-associated endoribonuclease Cas6 [Thermoplasma sp. Kam2015]PYB67579.1 CRISPR-associated endoribonuclease Cas6 [Thermoplasma sp. Kam2015]
MSRIIITLNSKTKIPADEFNKYYMNSLIHNLLRDAGIDYLHASNRFRYFTFSDFFPSGPLMPGDEKKIIISSPDVDMIKMLFEAISKDNFIYLGESRLDVADLKMFNLNKRPNAFITGSPIVISKDNRKNLYFSIRNDDSLSFFLTRLKQNAVKRYIQFTGKTGFTFEDVIFDKLLFNKEVSVRLRKMGREFFVIGSTWRLLKKERLSYRYIDFYRFLMDAGIGEKVSMGFGFLNPVNVHG